MRRTVDDYRACADLGLSKSDTARELGVTVQAVDDMAVRHNLAFVDGRAFANLARAGAG
jgi:hypothetical protein